MVSLYCILRIDLLDTSARLVYHVSVKCTLIVFPFKRISALENVDFNSAIRPLGNNLCTQGARYNCVLRIAFTLRQREQLRRSIESDLLARSKAFLLRPALFL